MLAKVHTNLVASYRFVRPGTNSENAISTETSHDVATLKCNHWKDDRQPINEKHSHVTEKGPSK